MVSTFTPNIQLEEPARGDDVGTWDTPVNANMTLLDLVDGGMVTISAAAGSIALAAAQFQCKTITINSTLLANMFITFPTSFKKSYEIQNLCSGTSAFVVVLQTTASSTGAQAVCAPPGEIVEVLNDGANLKFKNLGRIGSYMDYGGGGVPAWITACTVPPYLPCNGAAFSSATYPILNAIIGNTLPDFRGRSPFYLNEGTGRLTAAGAGINGDANFQAGGNNGVTLVAGQIPTLNCQGVNGITVYPNNNTGLFAAVSPGSGNISATVLSPSGGNVVPQSNAGSWSGVANFSGNNNISVNTQGTGLGQIVPATIPGCVAGVRLIRAG